MKYDGFEVPNNHGDSRLSPIAKGALIISGILLLLVAGSWFGKKSPTMTQSAPGPQIQTEQTAPIQPSQTPTVEFSLGSVTLDFPRREMEIRGRLTYKGPRPEQVWLWAYYFVPDSQYAKGSWSDTPLLVEHPFLEGTTAEVTARGHFHWADNDSAPKSGYYARVSHSAISAASATLPTELRNKSSQGATTVNIVR